MENTVKLTSKLAAHLALGALLPLAAIAPAHAEREVRHDPLGDSRTYSTGVPSYDITKVVLNHRKNVRIKVKFDRVTSDYIEVRVDVPGTGRKFDYQATWSVITPEFVVVQTRKQVRNDSGYTCELETGSDTRRTARMVIPRKCFGKPRKLKVHARSWDDQFFNTPTDRTKWTGYAKRY